MLFINRLLTLRNYNLFLSNPNPSCTKHAKKKVSRIVNVQETYSRNKSLGYNFYLIIN